MNDKPEQMVQVRVGLHHLDDKNIQSKTYDVEKIYLNDFSTPSKPGDIAVLKLTRPIEFKEGKIFFFSNIKSLFDHLQSIKFVLFSRHNQAKLSQRA